MARSMPLVIGILSAPTTEMYQVPGSRPEGSLCQVAGFVLITFLCACAMDDDLGSLHRSMDPLTTGKITSHKLDIPAVLAAAPAQHPYVASGILQPRNNQPPKRARAARNQSFHANLLVTSVACEVSLAMTRGNRRM
jgi:hypothetical protein